LRDGSLVGGCWIANLWVGVLAIVLGCFSFIDILFGTALGIYTSLGAARAVGRRIPPVCERGVNWGGDSGLAHRNNAQVTVLKIADASTNCVGELVSQCKPGLILVVICRKDQGAAVPTAPDITVPRPMGELLDYVDCGLGSASQRSR
jgi:hypothetical protein